MIRFLLASLALHAAVLALMPRQDATLRDSVWPSLSVRILPPRSAAPAPEEALLPKPTTATPSGSWAARRDRHDTAPTSDDVIMTDATAPRSIETIRPAVDLEAAFAAARRFANESKDQARKPLPGSDAPPLPLTVEAAIAKAARPDVAVESRGASGEWILQDGKKRCVTPTYIPHFLEGKTMLTQCEIRKD